MNWQNSKATANIGFAFESIEMRPLLINKKKIDLKTKTRPLEFYTIYGYFFIIFYDVSNEKAFFFKKKERKINPKHFSIVKISK